MDITSLALAKSFAQKMGFPIFTLDDIPNNFVFYKTDHYRAGYISLKGLKKGIYIPYSSTGRSGKEPGYYCNLGLYWEVTDAIANSGYAPIGVDFFIVMQDIKEDIAEGAPLCLKHQPKYSGFQLVTKNSKANFGYGVDSLYNQATEIMMPGQYAKITYEHIYNKLPVSEQTPTKATHFTTKKYVDDLVGDIESLLGGI